MIDQIEDILKRINDAEDLFWFFTNKATHYRDHDLLKKALEFHDYQDVIFNMVAALKQLAKGKGTK